MTEDNNELGKLNLTPNLDALQEQYAEQEAEETEVEEKEEISDKDLRKLVEYTTGMKDISDNELVEIREDDIQLERLVKIAGIKSANHNYRPKKSFSPEQRKKRQRKNKTARQSRAKNKR